MMEAMHLVSISTLDPFYLGKTMVILRMILFAIVILMIMVSLFALIFATIYSVMIIADKIKKLFKK